MAYSNKIHDMFTEAFDKLYQELPEGYGMMLHFDHGEDCPHPRASWSKECRACQPQFIFKVFPPEDE